MQNVREKNNSLTQETYFPPNLSVMHTYTTTHYTLVAIRYIFLKLSSFQNIFVNLASIVHDFVLVPSHLGM